MSPRTPRGSQPQQVISGQGTGNIGGIHFHGDITVQVDSSPDRDRYLAGYASLLRRQEETVARLLTGALSTPDAIESSLFGVWQRWQASPDWYESVIRHSARLVDSVDLAWRESAALRRWHDSTSSDRRTYSLVRQGMSRLKLDSLLGLLQQRLASEELHGERERLAAGLQSCRWLLEQSQNPQFATSMNTAGPFGSGRSRLLAEIAQDALAEGSLAFLLAPRAGESVGGAIRRHVAEGAGIGVTRFQDLARFLDGQPATTKIHILVDDVHLWPGSESGADELQELIDSSTETGRVRWVLAADSNGLDSLSGSDPFFWVRHGHVPAPQTLPQAALTRTTGWVDLEHANREQRVGFEILRSRAADLTSEIDTLVSDPEAFEHEFKHLVNPLGAWIRLDEHDKEASSGGQGQALTDVNSIPFVRSYWSWIKRRISTNDMARQGALEDAMRALSNSLTNQPDDHVVIDAATAKRHAAALADLVSGGIVRTSWIGDSELGDQDLRVDPHLPALLGLRVARLALPDHDQGSREAVLLSPWWPLAEVSLGLAEAACQFALTLNPPADGGLGDALWKSWTTQQASPKAPMLMAAITCGAEAEGIAVDCVARARYRPTKKRELFVLTRFAANARLTEWGADRRIEALKPHAEAIRAIGLEPYLHFALTRILESERLVSEANYLKVCQSLDGFPGEQNRELAADLLVKAGTRIYEDDQTAWIHTILRYCKKTSAADKDRRSPGPRRTSNRDRRGNRGPRQAEAPAFDAKNSFAAALTTAVSRHVVRTRGTDGVRMLATMGWWTAGDNYVLPALADHMRQKLTTEYGSTVHHGKGQRDNLDEYELVIKDLLTGNLLGGHREGGRIAYYLLKHSVPTYGRADVEIPEQLRPLLRSIQRDSKLTNRLAPEVYQLFGANGIGRRP